MAALAWFGFKQTCYRNSHSLSGFCQQDYRTQAPHLSDLPFLNGDQSRQGAVGLLELVTCGGEGEEGAQLWVPWAQPGAPGWPAAPSSWERRTSCMAAGPSSCVGDGKATCPRHWAPGFRLVVIRRPKTKTYPNLLHGRTTSPLLLHVHPMHIPMRHWTNLDWFKKKLFCMIKTTC